MRLLRNSGHDRVIDVLSAVLEHCEVLDLATESLSLFAFHALHGRLHGLRRARLIVSLDHGLSGLLGELADRPHRNTLLAPWLATECSAWLRSCVEVHAAPLGVPQGAAIVRHEAGSASHALLGAFALTTSGLGLAPGNPLRLIQLSETHEEADAIASWFESQWLSLAHQTAGNRAILDALQQLNTRNPARFIYALMLNHVLGIRGDSLDEDQVIKSATGIRNTVVWRRLYKFQRDGVVGAIDKLNRFGGCVIADSVGLGKTFEALAIIKYHELRNDRVLVLCPKRLRDNWTLYAANDRRNVLAADRFNYDVINHTDLSRDGGFSGDIDLNHINWGNYDLVVIDESHNFRNKKSPRQGGETRYDRLMHRIIKQGVRTRVLMLSATPVNNRLADLRNQIAFATEGDDAALADHGIPSIDAATRLAQKQFNRWLDLEETDRTPGRLVEMLGFDYFKLLDLLTIARSRKHIEKYYGTAETGRFPERLKPINVKTDIDTRGEFRSIRELNQEIRRLNLAAYAPLRYVLLHKQESYDRKYSTEVSGGKGFWRQVDREESLIHLLRVNVLKRLESSVHSFELTVQRQLRDVEATLRRIDAHDNDVEEPNIEDIDIDDPSFEGLLVGRKVKVLLSDVDLVRWRQDLIEDRNRLSTLLSTASRVAPERDAKLCELRRVIESKCRNPINVGNRKVLIFTAFADTAEYLYEHLAQWAKTDLGLDSAVVTGTGRNQTTLRTIRKDFTSILTCFSPRAKERPDDLAHEGDLDLLIGTDCISEGQNLQDCDCVINYDIHWNPVRIIQRFGRIDRIGSINDRIQLVNFWPNMELEEYINLEQRVSGKMVLLDVSASGEENLIETQSGNQMNDLEYRRTQLLKLQDAVIDLEDLSSGVSITDLTLTDFRIDLAEFTRAHPGQVEEGHFGTRSVTVRADDDIEPGIIFCLRAEGDAAKLIPPAGYPLAPYYLVHVRDDGSIAAPYTQVKQILDRLKRLCSGKDLPEDAAWDRFNRATKQGKEMAHPQRLLAAAVRSIIGKSEERAVSSLFTPGGTQSRKGEFAGTDDFEVIAYLVVLPKTDDATVDGREGERVA